MKLAFSLLLTLLFSLKIKATTTTTISKLKAVMDFLTSYLHSYYVLGSMLY